MDCPNIRFVSYNESRTLPQDLLRTLGSMTVSRQFSMSFIGCQCFIVSFLKSIHGMSPSYISDLVSIRSCSSYSLRSNYTIVLERPICMGRMLATLCARSFYAAAPTLWNSLHAHICEIESLGAFKRPAKTHLFRLAFM